MKLFISNENNFRKGNFIEVIEIYPAWFSSPGSIGNSKTSQLVAQLPKNLFCPTSIVVDNQMMIFGGLGDNQISNSDIFIFNVDNNNVSTLPLVFESMIFGQKTFLLPKGYI
jgi:hypothetical protein